MDLQATVRDLVAALAPALPFLLKGGEKAAEEAGKHLGAAAWQRAAALWSKLRGPVEKSSSAIDAAEYLVRASDDDDAMAALRIQLKRLLQEDSALLQDLATVLCEPKVETRLDASVSGSGAATQAGGVAGGAQSKVAAHDQYNAARDQHIHYHQDPAPAAAMTAEDTLRRRYLKCLFRECNRLPLGFVEAADESVRHGYLQLQAVYTALMTQMPREREMITGEGNREAQRPLSTVEALDRERLLVLHGGPGSGKSTFVNYVALCLAGEALGEEGANLEHLTNPLPDEEGADQDERQPERGLYQSVLVQLATGQPRRRASCIFPN